MKLTQEIGMTYSFKSGSAPFGEASDLSGYVDLATGMIWYTFTANGSDKIFSTNHPLYSYGTITVTNPDNGNHISYTDSQIMFAIDPTGRKCTMVMTNFAPNLVGAIQSYQIYWENLTLTPTATGYTISADQAESSLKGTNTITDVTIKLDDQCRALNGSFKCNDLDITVTSNMFPTADLY